MNYMLFCLFLLRHTFAVANFHLLIDTVLNILVAVVV